MVADYFHICPCGKKSQKEIRPGNIHTLGDFDRASALSMVRVLWGELPHRPGLLTGPSAVSAASACERTALRGISAATLLSSRAQARSAPRAHVRELLCVSQSSKEQLRRCRTESSGAAPAIEELPGEARQCKARRAAMRRSWQHGPVFSRAGRSGGRPALQLPRLLFFRGSSAYRCHPVCILQKLELLAPVLSFRGESADRLCVRRDRAAA